jgi:hypothetical protein
LLGYLVGFRWVTSQGAESLQAHVLLFTGLFVLYASAVWLVMGRAGAVPAASAQERVLLVLILGGGLLFRLALVPTPIVLSSDIYRYVWDGRVQRAGINPYRYPPAAKELSPLRDPDIYPHINRPTKPTVYPPGSEALYRLVFTLAPESIPAWRLFILGSESASVALLLRLLRRMGAPATAVVVYAWAPLVVFEGAQAGHVDLIVLPFILLALYWRQQGRMAPAGLALGTAVAMKLYPAVLLLVWRRRGDWRFPAACAVVVSASYAMYLPGAGLGVLGFLPEYFGSAEDFNVGLRYFLTEAMGLGGEVARGAVMLILSIVLLAVLFRLARRLEEDALVVLRVGMVAVAAYLVLIPTAMHAWYVVWILPFLTLRMSLAWMWFSGAVTLSYLKYAWEPAGLPFWARALEYLPLYGLLLWERARGGPLVAGGTPLVRPPGLRASSPWP